jgi:hypothetical protein
MLGRRRAAREPSPDHPFGYGRERYFYGFLVSLVLCRGLRPDRDLPQTFGLSSVTSVSPTRRPGETVGRSGREFDRRVIRSHRDRPRRRLARRGVRDVQRPRHRRHHAGSPTPGRSARISPQSAAGPPPHRSFTLGQSSPPRKRSSTPQARCSSTNEPPRLPESYPSGLGTRGSRS